MKLIDPGAGEISDRLSILSLKILFGRTAGKPVDHFEKEAAALLAKIRARTLNGAWFGLYTELAAVNAALWHAEDDLRAYRPGPAILDMVSTNQIVDLAFQIQSLNDRRAELVAAINKDAGELHGLEKAHVDG